MQLRSCKLLRNIVISPPLKEFQLMNTPQIARYPKNRGDDRSKETTSGSAKSRDRIEPIPICNSSIARKLMNIDRRAAWRLIPILLIAFFSTGGFILAAAGEELHQIFDEAWENTMKESPTWASQLGDRRYNDRWQDQSFAGIERRHSYAKGLLKKLDAIDQGALSEADKLNYILFRKDLEFDVEGHQYGWHLIPLNQRGGVHTRDQLSDSLRFTTTKDYEDWIARLTAYPILVDQTIALMTKGIETGMLHPKVIMERIPDQIAAQVVEDPGDSLFYRPFEKMPDSFEAADKKRLIKSARSAITGSVLPAISKFQTFFNEKYLPACYDKVGAWQLPQGKKLDALKARRFTTTELTPEQIHEIGRKEVKRIRAQMKEIIKEVKFEGTFTEFLDFLRTDSQFYFDNPEELLAYYRSFSKKVDPTLVKLFKTMPRMPYGVEPIPDTVAPDTTTAYYRQPAADGSRAGTYFVNLYKPEVRPKYEIEALSLHEAVPGHHFQISRAMELGDLPSFRRFGGYTAFVEGWALYAESLGDELGFYKDPYSKFGQLTYEMWRAVRLVVDTGMHTMGWSRQEAIDFFTANAAKTEHDIINEIDRYIAWPGQALAYKIGELKIKELRARATKKMGEAFDVREFHDVILGSGAVPLDILEGKVDAWIAKTSRASNSATGE
jgi:uncharacterized protein (DUF885 family)